MPIEPISADESVVFPKMNSSAKIGYIRLIGVDPSTEWPPATE